MKLQAEKIIIKSFLINSPIYNKRIDKIQYIKNETFPIDNYLFLQLF